MPDDRASFVRAHTRLVRVALVPEVLLHQADEPVGLWELTEGEYRSDQPPPFWAFAWSGGQALARYVLDHRATVSGASVLDLACGSGLVGIAAARAGAARVQAVDVDPTAVAAARLNAAANGVEIDVVCADPLDGGEAAAATAADVVLAGDVFYSKAMAERVFGFLRRAVRAGALVLIGDPDRAYLPRTFVDKLETYEVPVSEALESTTVKHTTVWRLRPPRRVPATSERTRDGNADIPDGSRPARAHLAPGGGT